VEVVGLVAVEVVEVVVAEVAANLKQKICPDQLLITDTSLQMHQESINPKVRLTTKKLNLKIE